MANIIKNMPKTFDQNSTGDKVIVSLRYFKSGADWYITKKNMHGGVKQAFGYTVIVVILKR